MAAEPFLQWGLIAQMFLSLYWSIRIWEVTIWLPPFELNLRGSELNGAITMTNGFTSYGDKKAHLNPRQFGQ